MHTIIYIMGVAGAGKTTIGKLLSAKINIPFFDADDFHPAANIEKMAAGFPLTDDDRIDWLNRIHEMAKVQSMQRGAIIACSALKKSYRTTLSAGLSKVHWIFLQGNFETIKQRLRARSGHFLPPSLLPSQFETLEIPQDALCISIDHSPEEITLIIYRNLFMQSTLGIIGMGVMGKSLARNAGAKGIALSLYNRFEKGNEEQVAEKWVAAHRELKNALPFENLEAFVASLQKPACILLMVPAGNATDAVREALLPLLSKGDIIIDGGNAHYKDTEHRMRMMEAAGLHWMGMGISGGEAGALNGPAMMPAGNAGAWETVKPLLEPLAAKDSSGRPCCRYIGDGGAGHFVKMVHNGIEYAEMQMLAEVYQLLRHGAGWEPDAIAAIFTQWNKGQLHSYLLEITIEILLKKDASGYLIDSILDEAASKGTGSWTAQTAAESGVPASMSTMALYMRYISAERYARQQARALWPIGHTKRFSIDADALETAYTLARWVNHHQGFQMVQTASDSYNWKIDLSALASIWTNGCIIRSTLMEHWANALLTDKTPLLSKTHTELVIKGSEALTHIVQQSLGAGIAVAVLADALHYLLALANPISPANIIQAQRDYFGAHTYQLKTNPDGPKVHTEWENA